MFSFQIRSGLSYAINEALAYGTKVIVTPLPYLDEINIKNNENALVLNFDLSNMKDVVNNIKNVSRVIWNVPEDNYKKYLAESKSKYEEMKKYMKKIRVKNKFKDMKHNNILRNIGEEFIEEGARADDLIARGFCTLVEEIKEKKEEVETAVKEEKKEKAVKEKAVKRNAKK